MVAGGLAVEEPGEQMMAVVSEAHPKDVRGWGGTRESGVGDDGFPPKK